MAGIVNEQALIDVYGRWPAFHDGEVLSVLLDRGTDNNPSLEVAIQSHEMTSEVVAGYYVLRNHRLVRLRFEDISDLVLEDFNGSNIIFDIDIKELDAAENNGCRYEIGFSSSYGMIAVFRCKRIEAMSVEPYSPT